MFERLTSLFACLVVISYLVLAIPATARDEKGVSLSLVIKAQPQVVFEVVKSLKTEGEVNQISGEKQSVVEEQFDGLPIIGKARCTYVEKYTPFQRVDYHMIRSDKFKAFQGSWVITPQAENSTTVRLTSYIDTGLPVPFAQQITNSAALKDVKKRLDIVKRTAEANQARLDSLSQRP